jgi:hypothetical protein
MNKIIPLCPKCEKPITYVEQGYLTVVASGGPSYEQGAVVVLFVHLVGHFLE